jgi:glucose/mannose-6-phosphate isomerase
MHDMRAAVAGFGDQLRWAAALELPEVAPASDLLVCGMGGSGISGDYLASLASARVTVHKSYGLPGWAWVARPLVLALSYSGETEETLSAVAEASEAGLGVVAVTTGGSLGAEARTRAWPCVPLPPGLQPRAALGYLLGATVRVAMQAGAVTPPVADLAEAAGVADGLVGPGGPGWRLAADLAAALDGRLVAVYGSGVTAPVANRWKTQVNENAKWPGWWSVLPELDHNEIVGWRAHPEIGRHRVGIVTLRDRAEPAAVARRFRLSEAVTRDDVSWIGEVWGQGESPLARMVSLTVLGDALSVELADLAGVDPVPVEPIEDLKRRMREES